MNFEKFRKLNEAGDYNPEVFEDEINGTLPTATPETANAPETSSAQAKGEMASLIEKYFGKGGGDAIKSLDGFSNDLVNALTEYLNGEWIVPEDFTGRDDALAQFRKGVSDIVGARVPKIGASIHDLGVQLQNKKNLSK